MNVFLILLFNNLRNNILIRKGAVILINTLEPIILFFIFFKKEIMIFFAPKAIVFLETFSFSLPDDVLHIILCNFKCKDILRQFLF